MVWLPLFLVFAVVIVPLVTLYFVRARAMQALALRRGFRYVGRQLPKSFYLRGVPLNEITWARNVIQGDINGIPILIFDCIAGNGKGSPCCSIFAAQTSGDNFPKVFLPEKVTRQHGWTAIYRFRYIQLYWALSIARIEELLDSLAACQ
jgi:hypothetical protein